MRISDAQKGLILVAIVASAYLIYLLAPILTPFMIALFLAYLGDPAVDKLQAIHFPRTLAVMFVFFLMLIIICCFTILVIPLLEDQISRLIIRTPEIIDWLQFELLPWLSNRFGLDVASIKLDEVKQSLMQHWQTIGNLAAKFITRVSASGQLLLLWVSYILLVPVVTFYLLRDWDLLLERIAGLIPQKYIGVVSKLAGDCDAILSEFLRGQLLVMFAQGVLYSIGLWIIGLELSLLIGMAAGIVSFVPYLGFIFGIAIAGITAFIQFQDIIHPVYVLIVFGVGQVVEGMLLSPLLIGDRIGLHPVAVIFAVMAGAQLFGFFGMLIALPAAAVITVVLRHLYAHYLNSTLYTQ